MSDQSSTKTILTLLAGIGIGAAIGAGAALLLSPNDGKTNRRKLREKIGKLSSDFKDKTSDLWSELEEELEELSKEKDKEQEQDKQENQASHG
jgi:gas vesicle protein